MWIWVRKTTPPSFDVEKKLHPLWFDEKETLQPPCRQYKLFN